MRGGLLLAVALLSGCSLAPRYVRPAAPVPPSWPVGDAYVRTSEATLPRFTYRDIFRDARLQRLIEQALINNRDLRIAAANVAAARASYRLQRAERLPVIGAGAGGSVAEGGNATSSTSRFSIDVGITAFEIDLFGRVASLTRAEQERYFASEAASRATRLALIGEIADAWTTYAADASLLKIAEDTVRVAERSVSLTRARLQGGIAPRTDLRQAEQILATARADIAEQRTALAQDVNALQLLVGAPIDPALLPTAIDDATTAIVALPPGLSSEILLRRPDVLQAEYELRAANATIGAARAALFPRLSLTGLLGFASTGLTSLFSGGNFSGSGGGDIGSSIFSGGAARAGVDQTQAQRDAAIAAYERAIQIAFREVADALARQGTIADQRNANRQLVDAAADTARLTEARYRGGVDSFLTSLDAQRALYSAQRTLISTEQVRSLNLSLLYRALGGEETAI